MSLYLHKTISEYDYWCFCGVHFKHRLKFPINTFLKTIMQNYHSMPTVFLFPFKSLISLRQCFELAKPLIMCCDRLEQKNTSCHLVSICVNKIFYLERNKNSSNEINLLILEKILQEPNSEQLNIA